MIFFTSNNEVQNKSARTFEEILFELKYNVTNYTKEEELRIEPMCIFKKNCLMKYLCTYIAQNILFQKKEESNEIKRSQNNYFLFITCENIYIFRYFWANKISPKCFLKMIFVPWRIILLGNSSKVHKSEIVKYVKTPGREAL